MSRFPEDCMCAAKATFPAAVALLLADYQVAIDLNGVDTKPFAGTYCPKGEFQGRLTFSRYTAVFIDLMPLFRPGALFIMECVGERWQYGIWHPIREPPNSEGFERSIS